MATVAATYPETNEDQVGIISWTPLTSTNTDGSPLSRVKWADKTVTITGTFGTGTVVIQGSNDGTNWFTLKDPANAALSTTSTMLRAILENPLYIRPLVTGGDGTTSITVRLVARRN